MAWIPAVYGMSTIVWFSSDIYYSRTPTGLVVRVLTWLTAIVTVIAYIMYFAGFVSFSDFWTAFLNWLLGDMSSS